MNRLCLFLLLAALLLLVTACSMPVSYYTNPNSAGYNQQKLGCICESCGRQFNISGNQLHNLPNVKCPYCGNFSNTKSSAARWVQIKKQLDHQANQAILRGIIRGGANGLNKQNSYKYRQSTTQYSQPVANDVCNCKGYDGPGGPCYDGPGGPAYRGPGGPAYDGPGGPCYDGPAGPEYSGPGGPAYDGPGGPRYSGPGGAAYDGPGGPAYDGPGGPCYSGPGGPCYSGPGGTGQNCPNVCR